MTTSAQRLHGLDALRAWALLLGILLHSTLSYLLPPGVWAVGTTEPSAFLGWLVYYLHGFRLEIFFLMAGFFGALAIERRGVRAYAWDRVRRILFVFIAVLYPMKFVLSALWIAGGRTTGWLDLPPLISLLPWYLLALGSVVLETSLTHLWFLYYLFWITILALAIRWLMSRVLVQRGPALDRVSRWFESTIAGRFGVPMAALLLTPLLAMMDGLDVDTPDRSFAWDLPVMAVYGLWFAFGWWLFRHQSWLQVVARRWRALLTLGVLASLVGSSLAAIRVIAGPWATAHADVLRWAASFATSLTMVLSVAGWTGLFVARGDRSSRPVRYLADASYFVYIAHLPVVVALQVWWVHAALPWWIQVPLVNAITLAVLLAAYHFWPRGLASSKPSAQLADQPPPKLPRSAEASAKAEAP